MSETNNSMPMPTAAAAAAAAAETGAPGYPWREHLFGDAMAARQSLLVLASYPILLLLVLLSAFIRYMWAGLATYCALLFVLSCAARSQVERRAAARRRSAATSLGGLSPAAIAAVAPAFPFDDDDEEAAQECAVCLEALRGGEKARRLPACEHAFHVACIDMWLDSHAACPLCRCHVLPKIAAKELPDPSLLPGAPPQAPAEAPLPPV